MSYDKKLLDSFKKFISSDFLNRDYENYETFFGNVVLVRVFRHEPPDFITGLVNADGSALANESKRRIATYGKVISVGDKCELENLQIGDIVALSDNLIGIQDNPAFVDYLIQTNGENSRGLEAAKPSQTISSFMVYRQTYGFVGDKLKGEELDADDFFTFLFPTSFIKARLDKKKLEEWISKNSKGE